MFASVTHWLAGLGKKIFPGPSSRQITIAITGELGGAFASARHFRNAYIEGWHHERALRDVVELPGPSCGEGRMCLTVYKAGSRDYALELAEKKGPRNAYTQTGKRLLTSADKDYD